MRASELSCEWFLARASVFDSYKMISSSSKDGVGIARHVSKGFGTLRGFATRLQGHVEDGRGY